MKIENFCCVAAELQNKMTGTTKMSQIYYYRAYEEETLEDMLATGFFNNIQDRVKKDDIILLYYPNTNGDLQMAWVKVVSNIGGIVTVEQIAQDSSSAEYWAELAKDWATKMNGTVDGVEYSAKYYASQAASVLGDVAHLSGTETFTGNKTFTKPISFSMSLTDPVDVISITDTDLHSYISLSCDYASSGMFTDFIVHNYASNYDADLRIFNNDMGAFYLELTGSGNAENLSLSGADTSTSSTVIPTKGWVNRYKQDTLVSGTNIKTLNGSSILGSGDLEVSTYHPTLFTFQWSDCLKNDVQWLRADTFSWQSGTVYEAAYEHLVDDIDGKTAQTETIGSYTITYYEADDGHKIVLADQETTVQSIYAESGVAWYYILDTANTRFKLPRGSHGEVVEKYSNGTEWYRVYSDGWCEQGGESNGNYQVITLLKPFADTNYTLETTPLTDTTTMANNWQIGNFCGVRVSASQIKIGTTGSWFTCGYISTPPANSQYKHLYFYVGSFTQTALENTAGITAETLNSKVDKGHEVIEFQAPTAANSYTWYRLYADGWVEQGGINTQSTSGANYATITLPIVMSDTNYTIIATKNNNDSGSSNVWGLRVVTSLTTTTSFSVRPDSSGGFHWQVSGMAAQ